MSRTLPDLDSNGAMMTQANTSQEENVALQGISKKIHARQQHPTSKQKKKKAKTNITTVHTKSEKRPLERIDPIKSSRLITVTEITL
jgi:hypothetical protein